MKIHPVFHVSLLEPRSKDTFSNQRQEAPQPIEIDGEDHYEVEEILDSRIHRGNLQYLVHWLGYEEADRSWEPLSNLNGCEEAIKEFHNLYPDKPSKNMNKYSKNRRTPRRRWIKKGIMLWIMREGFGMIKIVLETYGWESIATHSHAHPSTATLGKL